MRVVAAVVAAAGAGSNGWDKVAVLGAGRGVVGRGTAELMGP